VCSVDGDFRKKGFSTTYIERGAKIDVQIGKKKRVKASVSFLLLATKSELSLRAPKNAFRFPFEGLLAHAGEDASE